MTDVSFAPWRQDDPGDCSCRNTGADQSAIHKCAEVPAYHAERLVQACRIPANQYHARISVTDRTAPVLREAIARVLKDEDIRRTAHRIGGDIAGMPAVEEAVERMAALAAGAAKTAHSLPAP